MTQLPPSAFFPSLCRVETIGFDLYGSAPAMKIDECAEHTDAGFDDIRCMKDIFEKHSGQFSSEQKYENMSFFNATKASLLQDKPEKISVCNAAHRTLLVPRLNNDIFCFE